jgi:hypothetical protein
MGSKWGLKDCCGEQITESKKRRMLEVIPSSCEGSALVARVPPFRDGKRRRCSGRDDSGRQSKKKEGRPA